MLRDVPEPLAQRVQDYLGNLGHDQASAVRGLGTRLAIITESHTGSYLQGASPNIDLRAALAGDQVVLFSLNSSKYGKLSAQLAALAIQDLVSAAGHRLTLPERGPQAVVGIDEFSALDSDNVISLLARCREAGISVLLSTQELADLDRSARGLRDQVLGSTAIKIAHRQEVPASARTIAQIAGSETVWEESRQTTDHPLFGARDAGRGTRRLTERFKVHPDEIASLPPGHAVLISKLPAASVRTVRVAPPRRAAPPGRASTRQAPELS
jgi:type IV secretory pathway TraG/TraD family ATPase VirD4